MVADRPLDFLAGIRHERAALDDLLD